MKTRVLLCLVGLLTCTALGSTPVRADGTTSMIDKASCLDAVSKGQKLRGTHKLVMARDKFRVCARAECPAVVQTDCAGWLADVERTLPTVVLTAKDRSGRDLIDVKVSLEGQPIATTLDGQGIAVDPGVRTFRFERADGVVATKQVLIKEGEKAQSVSIVLAGTEPGPAILPVQGPTGEGADGSRTTFLPPEPARPGNPVRLIGLLVGASGLIGMGVAGGVAIDAKVKDVRASSELGLARQTDSASAVSQGNVATVLLGVGGAVALAGVVLLIAAPSPSGRASAPAQSGPYVATGTNGHEVFLYGSF